MRFNILFIAILLLVSCNNKQKEQKSESSKITENKSQKLPNIYVVKHVFPSKDSLLISADLYEVDEKKPIVLLCHQAGYSRGEYIETAKKLNYLGYSCMAIDQRSGKEVNNTLNETAQRAKDKNLPTNYLDAKIDIEAAINYLYDYNGNQPILLVGSSYSASLAMLLGKDNPKVKAVAAFSPGNYFGQLKVSDNINDFNKPVFVTSSKSESIKLTEFVKDMNPKTLSLFVLENKEGIHGSRALWETTDGSNEYWNAFNEFLKIVD